MRVTLVFDLDGTLAETAPDIMAALNPNVHHVAIDGALFQDEVERRKVMAVPMVFLTRSLQETLTLVWRLRCPGTKNFSS